MQASPAGNCGRDRRDHSDSAKGYRHKAYAIAMAQKLNPGAEPVIDRGLRADPLTRQDLREYSSYRVGSTSEWEKV